MQFEQVDSFEKNEGFSDYWDQFVKEPIQASYWGIDPDGGVHSFMHEGEAVDCATATDIVVFMAELAILEEDKK
jgi:hypothetical protein